MSVYAVIFHSSDSELDQFHVYNSLTDAIKHVKGMVDEHNDDLDNDKSNPDYYLISNHRIKNIDKSNSLENLVAYSKDNSTKIYIKCLKIHNSIY